MSTRADQTPVYLEFPDFGYGPAAGLLTLIAPIVDDYTWHVVSTGSAAEFVSRHLPRAVVHDVNTFSPDAWPAVLDIMPRRSSLISVTNPQFAGWAAQHGYRTCVVDALDWMWDSPPHGIEKADLHLVQSYFGQREGTRSGFRQPIRPLVDTALWESGEVTIQQDTAVVGFGGMSVPGRERGTARYVEWMLSAVLPVLVERANCARVTVTGGRADITELVPEQWRKNPVIDIRVSVDRAGYADLLRSAQHLVLAPGLAALYECAAAGLAPFVQPGFNMSMVLQVSDLVATGYPHVAAWPWLDTAVAKLAGLPELDGLTYLADLIDNTVLTTDADSLGVGKGLMAYLDREPATKLHLPAGDELPDGRQLVAQYLRGHR